MAEMIVGGELFKTIPGHEDYLAGENGSILSLKSGSPRPLRHVISKSTGYLYVNLCGGSAGTIVTRTVHSLVLRTFVGPRPKGMEACHDNGVRTDARLVNLRWDTRKNNHADKKRHGTWQGGDNHAQAVLTEAIVLRVKEMLVAGGTNRSIAKELGVDESTIGAIRTGKNWRHVAPELHASFPKSYPFNANSLKQQAERMGIKYHTVHARVRKGWTVEDALTRPVATQHRRKTPIEPESAP